MTRAASDGTCEDSKAVRPGEPGSLNHHLEESCLLTGNTNGRFCMRGKKSIHLSHYIWGLLSKQQFATQINSNLGPWSGYYPRKKLKLGDIGLVGGNKIGISSWEDGKPCYSVASHVVKQFPTVTPKARPLWLWECLERAGLPLHAGFYLLPYWEYVCCLISVQERTGQSASRNEREYSVEIWGLKGWECWLLLNPK